LRLLTDPLLRDRIGPLRWAQRCPPPSLAQGLSAVLVSHQHRDHLDLPSLALVPRDVPIVVPRGAGRLFSAAKFGQVLEIGVGDEVSLGSVTVRAVHAEHDGRRARVGSPTQALGYLIRGGSTVYFAGDTDLHPAMADLAAERVDLALLPVGGWGATLPSGHLGPQTAAEALQLIRPVAAVPIHWGTLRLPVAWRTAPARFTEPGTEFAAAAAAVAPRVRVVVAEVGRRVDVSAGTS
jgi:L-ascorbate metabolism protein UlaG (beta-lactamase superfamily)